MTNNLSDQLQLQSSSSSSSTMQSSIASSWSGCHINWRSCYFERPCATDVPQQQSSHDKAVGGSGKSIVDALFRSLGVMEESQSSAIGVKKIEEYSSVVVHCTKQRCQWSALQLMRFASQSNTLSPNKIRRIKRFWCVVLFGMFDVCVIMKLTDCFLHCRHQRWFPSSIRSLPWCWHIQHGDFC